VSVGLGMTATKIQDSSANLCLCHSPQHISLCICLFVSCVAAILARPLLWRTAKWRHLGSAVKTHCQPKQQPSLYVSDVLTDLQEVEVDSEGVCCRLLYVVACSGLSEAGHTH